MKQNCADLTGDAVVRGVRKKNNQKRLLCLLGVLAAAAALTGAFIWIIKMHEFFYGGILAILCAFGAYMAFTGVSKANKVLADVENCRLFRKFGTPESIASRIASECGEPLLDSKGTLICNSFIMKHGDFESFIPFEQTLHLFRREHRTNGIQDGVYLVMTDAYGDQQQFPFKIGKKGKAQMEEIVDHIIQQAPNCAVGYTKEALAYVKLNKKDLEN